MLRVRVRAASIHKVPNLDGSVTRGSRQEVSTGVEGAAADPILMSLSAHYQVTVWYRPELPGSVIRSCRDDVLLRVVRQAGDRHQMALMVLEVAQVGPNSLKSLVQSGVETFTLRNRRRLSRHLQSPLRFFCLGGRFLTSRHAGSTDFRGGETCFRLALEPFSLRLFLSLLFLHLSQVELQVIDLCLQSVFFQLHEHLLLQSSFVLISIQVELRLEVRLRFLSGARISVQLFLLLLDASVVNLFEVFLLAELVISGASFLSDDAGFIKLFLKYLELVSQLSIFPVNLWNIGNFAQIKFTLSFLFEPFLLEVFESGLHAEFDEKVAKEFISQLVLTALGGAGILLLYIFVHV